ncbi:transcriptional repressor [Candidatus Parcubacteria bacterium]|nr:MAG: transcriptional repressor [Candidatus Parcubacteria bacterium]
MYEEILRQAGYKLTKARETIISFLKKQDHPVSANYIYDKIKKDSDKVTVYRILEVFEKVGIVYREQGIHESLYYISQKEHHHIICQKCGHVECIPCDHVFPKVKNFTNIRHQLSLSGLCGRCSR